MKKQHLPSTSSVGEQKAVERSRSPEIITLNNELFFHVQDRLGGGSVYANEDKSAFARVGSHFEVEGEANLTYELRKRGFPVPEVIAQGILDDGQVYYIEKSLGKQIFGLLFKEETQQYGHVTDESFQEFLEVVKCYVDAQVQHTNFVPQEKDVLASLIRLELVFAYLPPQEEQKEEFFLQVEKAWQKVQDFPWGYIQADFNPFNVLHDGIIDFELAGFGPVGYDVVSCIYFSLMWPKDVGAYVFTKDQVQRYEQMLDEHFSTCGLPKPSAYKNEFILLKSIWATGKDHNSQKDPMLYKEFWEWRVRLRDWCLTRYSQGEPLDLWLYHQEA